MSEVQGQSPIYDETRPKIISSEPVATHGVTGAIMSLVVGQNGCTYALNEASHFFVFQSASPAGPARYQIPTIVQQQGGGANSYSTCFALSGNEYLTAFGAVAGQKNLIFFFAFPPRSPTPMNFQRFIEIETSASRISCVQFSPDSTQLAVGTSTGSLHLIDVAKNEVINRLDNVFRRGRFGASISQILFHESEEWLILSSDSSKDIKIIELEEGNVVRTLRGHSQPVLSMCFQDEDHIFSGSQDRTVRLWSLSSGECIKMFEGHRSWVASVDYDLSTHLLVSAGNDKSIRLWDVDTGTCRQVLEDAHNEAITHVRFSADGTSLASAGRAKMLKFWSCAN